MTKTTETYALPVAAINRYEPRPAGEINTITTTGRIPLETTAEDIAKFQVRADDAGRLARDVAKLQKNIEEFLAHWERDREFWEHKATVAGSNATATERARAAACVRYCGECDCPKLTENAIKSGESH